MGYEEDRTKMLRMYKAMQTYGGGFVTALSECFMRADHLNLARLYAAFPEIVKQYEDMADREERKGE